MSVMFCRFSVKTSGYLAHLGDARPVLPMVFSCSGRRRVRHMMTKAFSVFGSSSRPLLGPFEQQLLEELWQRGSATVRELIADGTIRPAYTTVMTTVMLSGMGSLMLVNQRIIACKAGGTGSACSAREVASSKGTG